MLTDKIKGLIKIMGMGAVLIGGSISAVKIPEYLKDKAREMEYREQNRDFFRGIDCMIKKYGEDVAKEILEKIGDETKSKEIRIFLEDRYRKDFLPDWYREGD